MELHQLRYLVAVAEHRSFSRAAERVRVAQPALSQQIQKLEAEMGQPLFDRLVRNVQPTEAGRRLLTIARKILTDVADARRCVDECRDGMAGVVRLGLIPTIAPYVLLEVLSRCGEAYPRLQIEIAEDVTANLARALEDGEIDLAIVSTCRSDTGIQRELWTREPLLAALPEKHPLAKRKRVTWDNLRDETFLMLHETHCLSQQIERLCRQHRMKSRSTLPTMQLSTIMAMIAAGQGVSLIPLMAVAHERNRGCVFLPLREPEPRREINVLRSASHYHSKVVSAFAEIARQTIQTSSLLSSHLPNEGAQVTSHRLAGNLTSVQ